MQASAVLAQGCWVASSLAEAARFTRGVRDVGGTQWRLLRRILRENADTDFGRRYRFDRIRTPEEYQARVPASGHDGFSEFIDRIARGESRVLTAAPVLRLEPTSGSTGARKLIPYTRALQADFARGVAPWVVDLFGHDPSLLAGPAYWSVTPAVAEDDTTSGGIPIGFEDDAVYLGFARGALARAALAAPSALRRLDDIESFRYATRLALLRARDLRLVSVWHPSFFLLLTSGLANQAERLALDVERGTVTPPQPLPPAVSAALDARPAPARAREIRRLVACHGDDERSLLDGLWPRLRLLSCWDGGEAARPAAELARRFFRARVQGKGLIATEGFVTLPLSGLPAPVLAVRSHFFEFMPPGGGTLRLAQALEPGSEYSLVLTTSGGLYRYRLGDRVRCVGYHHHCPMLAFLGREGRVSDHVGEKLSEAFVRQAFAEAFAARGFTPRFAMLSWEDTGYALCLESDVEDDPLVAVAATVERALSANPHYAYARRLGQLEALRPFRVEGDGHAAHLASCAGRGQPLGGVKPTSLWQHANWTRGVRGRWLAGPAGARR